MFFTCDLKCCIFNSSSGIWIPTGNTAWGIYLQEPWGVFMHRIFHFYLCEKLLIFMKFPGDVRKIWNLMHCNYLYKILFWIINWYGSRHSVYFHKHLVDNTINKTTIPFQLRMWYCHFSSSLCVCVNFVTYQFVSVTWSVKI
jgi:hypothetical protein